MAKVHIHSGQGAVGTGDLQLQNGAPMDATLRPVTDAANTASPLELSTGLVAVSSTLQIATNDTQYIDAEDGSGNNRFTVSRASGSQVVNVDYASNPTSPTDQVGAIRTYADGASLSDAVSFLRNGNVGIGTSAPATSVEIARKNSSINDNPPTIRLTDTDTTTSANQITGQIEFYTSDNSPLSAGVTSYVASITESTSALGALTFGTGQSGSATERVRISSDGNVTLQTVNAQLRFQNTVGPAPFIANAGTNNQDLYISSGGSERMRINSAGNVGIGTTTPSAPLQVDTTNATLYSGSAAPSAYNSAIQNLSNTTGSMASLALSSRNTAGDVGVCILNSVSTSTFRTAELAIQTRSNGVFAERVRVTANGLTFNGDTAAANALDDYEEGTWTPVVRGSGTAGTYELGTTYANYTKIGRQVTLNAVITLSSSITGGGTGYLQITGAPFTKSANQEALGSCWFLNVDFTSPFIVPRFISTSATATLYFIETVDNASPIDLPISAISASDILNLSITYFV